LLLKYHKRQKGIQAMADRSRSRSPDRGAPSADDQHHSAPGDADGPSGGGADGEEVKLYVGNLDYGALI
jgi:hypothetical protein